MSLAEPVAPAIMTPVSSQNEPTIAGDSSALPIASPAALSYFAAHPRRPQVYFGDYLLLQTLGEGEFGKVKLGVHRQYGEETAIKLIKRERVAAAEAEEQQQQHTHADGSKMSKVEREISVLKLLRHPNIVHLYEVIESERYIGIVLEYGAGGELFDYILAQKCLKERDACRLFAQLISGVSYLHRKKIIHRDLKLENLLLDKNRNVIITDFGFANNFSARSNDLMATSCGSPCYAAPELVVQDGMYVGAAVDVWSCGVILYAMLAGYLPFDDDPANPDGDNINMLYKYIMATPLSFPEYITAEPRSLLSRMLVPDPTKRATLEEVMSHSWLAPYRDLFRFSVDELESAAIEQQAKKRQAYRDQMVQQQRLIEKQYERSHHQDSVNNVPAMPHSQSTPAVPEPSEAVGSVPASATVATMPVLPETPLVASAAPTPPVVPTPAPVPVASEADAAVTKSVPRLETPASGVPTKAEFAMPEVPKMESTAAVMPTKPETAAPKRKIDTDEPKTRPSTKPRILSNELSDPFATMAKEVANSSRRSSRASDTSPLFKAVDARAESPWTWNMPKADTRVSSTEVPVPAAKPETRSDARPESRAESKLAPPLSYNTSMSMLAPVSVARRDVPTSFGQEPLSLTSFLPPRWNDKRPRKTSVSKQETEPLDADNKLGAANAAKESAVASATAPAMLSAVTPAMTTVAAPTETSFAASATSAAAPSAATSPVAAPPLVFPLRETQLTAAENMYDATKRSSWAPYSQGKAERTRPVSMPVPVTIPSQDAWASSSKPLPETQSRARPMSTTVAFGDAAGLTTVDSATPAVSSQSTVPTSAPAVTLTSPPAEVAGAPTTSLSTMPVLASQATSLPTVASSTVPATTTVVPASRASLDTSLERLHVLEKASSKPDTSGVSTTTVHPAQVDRNQTWWRQLGGSQPAAPTTATTPMTTAAAAGTTGTSATAATLAASAANASGPASAERKSRVKSMDVERERPRIDAPLSLEEERLQWQRREAGRLEGERAERQRREAERLHQKELDHEYRQARERLEGQQQQKPVNTLEIALAMEKRLGVHSGPVDQAALTTRNPEEVFVDIIRVLQKMGIAVRQSKGEFSIECLRPKRLNALERLFSSRRHDDSRSKWMRFGSGKTSSGAGHQQASRVSMSDVERNMNRLSMGPGMTQTGTGGGPGGMMSTSATAQSLDSYSVANVPPEYGGSASGDGGHEVRFTVELTRIVRLQGLYSVDIRRMKGNVWSYKYLYESLLERLDLGSHV